ncbi:hypothetical protein LTR48_004774 [Friedmanniomyces endolithicus]|uniref:Uncharacterized protein n=1 Tax=Rachicladosporium monterosium TaxID=1507873 RepID=A0ABR0L3P4_9PEZI|nr:hypothetical protein LTR48_004774 [Friedmanniomyces endolithicus]KAK5143039.1 hypothetical protein LTR32_004743 [Rachicladosporium monterosium]
MADGYALLLGEVDRVVNSPYPTQLKSLGDIVSTRCSSPDIDRCLRVRLCTIERLGACLLEGLRHWPYVLEIITKLSHNLAFRGALLKLEPGLLPTLLGRATPGDGIHVKYAAAAVAVLAHPLPAHYALPATAQTLFLRLVQKAAHTPSAESLSPVFALLQGTSPLLVGLLSNETLSRLEEQLDTILRSNHSRTSHDAGDQLRTLHCLAIMHLIALPTDSERIYTNSMYETQDLLASTQMTSTAWTPAEMQKYFHGTKASKTIQLVVLQAMWACQAHSESFDDRLATLKLANFLMGAVPTDLKDAWCSGNHPIVQKLQQKALACQQSKALQLHAFALICQLCKPVLLQCSVVEGIRHALASPQTFVEVSYSGLGEHWAHCLWEIIDGDTVGKLLQRILDMLSLASPAEIVEGEESMAIALQQLGKLSLENPEIADAARVCLATTSSFTQQLGRLLPFSGTQANRSGRSEPICESLQRAAYSKITHQLAKLLLMCAFNTQHLEVPLAASIFDTLLELHAETVRNTPACSHGRQLHQIPRADRILVEQESTPLPPDERDDWRVTLEASLASEARSGRDVLCGIFTRACQDLERRCESIERPLLYEQAKRTHLQEQYDQLQEAYSELEVQIVDRRLHYGALETEKEAMLKSLEVAQDESTTLHQRLQGLELTYEAERRESEVNRAEEKQAKEKAGLQHATALSKMQEDMEELQERFESVQSSLQLRETQMAKLTDELHGSKVNRESLQAQVDRLSSALQDRSAEVRSLETASGETVVERARLEAALQSVQDELDQERRNHERNVQQVKEQSRQNAEAANASHNDAIDHMASQHGEEVAGLERQIAEGEQQVKRLQRKCRQKDDQIAEAAVMRSNLLAALGGGAQTLMQPSLPHRTRASSRTQATQPATTPMTPSFELEMSTQAFDGRASLTSDASSTHSRNGPTPKRAKPRKSIAVSPHHKPRMSMGIRTMRAAPSARTTETRRPLSALNANASPQKEGMKTPSKGALNIGEDEFDGSTIDEMNVM